MRNESDTPWITLRPPLRGKASREAFLAHARALAKAQRDNADDEVLDDARAAFAERARASRPSDRQALVAAGLVLGDLAMQAWRIRIRGGVVGVRAPSRLRHDRLAEKARVRRQELVKRNAQLRQAAVQKFLRSMERSRLVNGEFRSIFSLMRDGRELAGQLRGAREHISNGWADALARVTDPYLEFVSSDEVTCSFTGMRLMDIWRYFRHTWTNQYTSVPGRTMMFLVRDRAASLHPIVGIGALSSPVMQIRDRDKWIGWHPETFLTRVKERPTRALAQWLVKVIDAAIGEIYVDDLLEDHIISVRDLSAPGDAAIDRLLKTGTEERRLHYRYTRSRDHKGKRPHVVGDDFWVARARTHLFRSKRALALASYLRARAIFRKAFGRRATAKALGGLANTGQGSDAIRRALKKAKADRVGIAVADITVCGAVQPYNAILGGKLVSMLATSPEVVLEYRHRYARSQSEIASSMAGRAIVRVPELVLLGTTSLYGVGSSQYNRISIPCNRLGGSPDDAIRYEKVGYSEAFGTSQYSEETIDALADLVQQSAEGQRVNSIFGEGISPKLRKVRRGLDLLGLPSELLLRHHRPRVVYAVSLVRDLSEHLLGIEPKAIYLVPISDGATATARIAAWWRERWLRNRIGSDEVLAEVARHTLSRPIRHGARVPAPRLPDQQLLFGEPY
jgi:uncharacterized protein DUF4338